MSNSKQISFRDNNNKVHQYAKTSMIVQQNLMDLSVDYAAQQMSPHHNIAINYKSESKLSQKSVHKHIHQNNISKGDAAYRIRKTRHDLELLAEDLEIFDDQAKPRHNGSSDFDSKSNHSFRQRQGASKIIEQEQVQNEKDNNINQLQNQMNTPINKRNVTNTFSEHKRKALDSLIMVQRENKTIQQKYTNLKNRIQLNKLKDDRTLFEDSQLKDMIANGYKIQVQCQGISQMPKRFRDSIGNLKAAIRINSQFQRQCDEGSQTLSRKSKNYKQGNRFSLVSQEEINPNEYKSKVKKTEPKLPPGDVFIDPNWGYRQMKQALVKYFSKENIIKRIDQTKLQIYSCEQQIKSHRNYLQQIIKQNERINVSLKDALEQCEQKQDKINSIKTALLPDNYYKKTANLRKFQTQNNVQIHKLAKKSGSDTFQFYLQFTMHGNMLVKLKRDLGRSITDMKIKMSYLSQQTQDEVFFSSQNMTDILRVNFKKNLQSLNSPVQIIEQFSQIYADLKRFTVEMDNLAVCFSLQDIQIDSLFDKLTFKFTLLPNLFFLFDIDLTKLYIADAQFIRIYNPRDNQHVQFQLIETKSVNPIFNAFYSLVNKYVKVI